MNATDTTDAVTTSNPLTRPTIGAATGQAHAAHALGVGRATRSRRTGPAGAWWCRGAWSRRKATRPVGGPASN